MNKTKIAIFVILLLALALLPAVFAQDIRTGKISPQIKGSAMFVQNWNILVLAGLALAAALVAVTAMAGHAFNHQGAKAFARAEAREFLFSIVLVLFVMGSLYAFGQFSAIASTSKIGPGSGAGRLPIGHCAENDRIYNTDDGSRPENFLYAHADWFLGCMPLPSGTQGDTYYAYDKDKSGYVAQNIRRDMVPDTDANGNRMGTYHFGPNIVDAPGKSKGVMLPQLTNIYISLFSLEFWLGPISTFGTSFYGVEGIISNTHSDFAPNAGLTPLSEATITITDLIGVGIGVIFTQKVLLQFFYINALSVFLPMGFAFRAIPFMRKTGSTIIALALVAYFIFPMTIWINYNIYSQINPAEYSKRPMMDWTNYQALMQIGSPRPGESAQDFQKRVAGELGARQQQEEQGTWQKILGFLGSKEIGMPDWLLNILNGGAIPQWIKDSFGGKIIPDQQVSANGMDIALPANQLNTLRNAIPGRLIQLLGTQMQVGAFPLYGVSMAPEFLFESLTDELAVSMQWFALNAIFLLITIVITVTLFRDISLTIGGDPRIFGLSKLV